MNSCGHILTVDHDKNCRQAIVSYLEDSGFIALQASDVDEALAVFHEMKPHLVLCDLQVPTQGGLSLLDSLKNESPETPFIMLSNTESMSEVIQALRHGAWDFITKPISNLTVLEHVVCKALERGRLVIENKNYRQELELKNVQLSSSLNQLKEDQVAGESVQQKLLPEKNFSYKNYHFSHKVVPSLYLSGDFVDYFKINQDKVGFYIADVSGHGASSAFVTILLKSFVNNLLALYQTKSEPIILHPEQVLKAISTEILEAKLGKYLTMIYGVLDVKDNILHYSVGGHYPNPILWDNEKSSFLNGKGFAVGILARAKFESYTVFLPDQFTLALFSDGIFEVMPGKDLAEKELKLLQSIKKTDLNTEDVLLPLGVHPNTMHPDDITLLLINHS